MLRSTDKWSINAVGFCAETSSLQVFSCHPAATEDWAEVLGLDRVGGRLILTVGGDGISRNGWWLGICQCVDVSVHDYTACFIPYVLGVFTLKEPSAGRII